MPRSNPTLKQKIKVELRFGRNSHGDFYLEISDKSSSSCILDICIPPEHIADFFSNQNVGWQEEVNITADYYPNPNIGKKVETKNVELFIDSKRDFNSRAGDLSHASIKWEKENPDWKIDQEGWNGHKYSSGSNTYRVIARRYV